MIGRTHRRFWKCFEKLPAPVQKLTREKYALWKRDPYHASLHFEERRNGIVLFGLEIIIAPLVCVSDVVAWFWNRAVSE